MGASTSCLINHPDLHLAGAPSKILWHQFSALEEVRLLAHIPWALTGMSHSISPNEVPRKSKRGLMIMAGVH